MGGQNPPHSVSQETKFVGNPNIISILVVNFLPPITSVILSVCLSGPIITTTCWIILVPVGTFDVLFSVVLIPGLGAGEVVILTNTISAQGGRRQYS